MKVTIEVQQNLDQKAFDSILVAIGKLLNQDRMMHIIFLGKTKIHYTYILTLWNMDTVKFEFRPEVVESYFYMWRFTKDQKYRDWAWEAVLVSFHYLKNRWIFESLFRHSKSIVKQLGVILASKM